MIENDALLYILSYWIQGCLRGLRQRCVPVVCELSRYGDSYLFSCGEHPEMLTFLLGWP